MRNVILLLCFLISSEVLAQDIRKMEIKNSSKIYLKGKRLNREEVKKKLWMSDKQFLKQYQKGLNQKDWGMVLMTMGTATGVANTLFWAYGDESAEYSPTALYIVSGALIVTSIPLFFSGEKNIKNSIEKYNEYQETSTRLKIKEISLINNRNGAGLALKF